MPKSPLFLGLRIPLLCFLAGAAHARENPSESPPAAAPEPSAQATTTPPTTSVGLSLDAPPPPSQPTYDGPPLVLHRRASVGGYGGLFLAYTRMFGEDGALVGARGGVLLDHRYSLGAAVFGWTNAQPGPNDADGNARRFQAGYGGLELRYAFWGRLPIYASIGGVFGAGAVVLAPDEHSDSGSDFSRDDVDVFMVAQPELTVYANLQRWMRLGVTAGYRFVADVERFDFDGGDVGGPVAGLDLQFGWL